MDRTADPYAHNLDFLDQISYFLLSSSSSVVLTKLSGPRSKPTTSLKILYSDGNLIRTSGSVARTLTSRPQRRSFKNREE
jgi:hypothetical protein